MPNFEYYCKKQSVKSDFVLSPGTSTLPVAFHMQARNAAASRA